MMANQASRLEEGLTPECKACLRDDKKVNAKIYCYECEENMCVDCNIYHKKIKSSLDHKVCDIEANSTEIEAEKLVRQLARCPDHKQEEVRYLCNDHDTLCCNECAIVNHRKCENLVSLIEVEDTKLSKNDEINAEKKLEELENSIGILSEIESKRLGSIKEANTELQKELNELKTKIDNAFKKLETTVLRNLKERSNCVFETSSVNASKISLLKNNLSLLKQTADAVRINADPKNAILFKRKLTTELPELEEQVLSLSHDSVSCEIRIVELKPVDDIIKSIGNCLQVKVNSPMSNSHESLPSQKQADEGNNFRERVATLEQELDYDSFGCPKYCIWVGKYIIVAIQDQLELLQFDAERMTFLSAYKCLSYPCSMTRIDDMTIAVSLPEVESIIVMNVFQRQLELKSKVSSKSVYHAISYMESTEQLICLSQTASAIDFVTVDGHQKYAVPLTENVMPKLQSAHAIAFDAKTERTYVSCTDWDAVIALDKNGQSLGELTHGEKFNLRGPLDIVVDSESNVYVFGRGGNPILQCDKDLNVIREILHTENKLEYAYSMSFNKDMSKFVVSEQHGQGSLYLKVYSFK